MSNLEALLPNHGGRLKDWPYAKATQASRLDVPAFPVPEHGQETKQLWWMLWWTVGLLLVSFFANIIESLAHQSHEAFFHLRVADLSSLIAHHGMLDWYIGFPTGGGISLALVVLYAAFAWAEFRTPHKFALGAVVVGAILSTIEYFVTYAAGVVQVIPLYNQRQDGEWQCRFLEGAAVSSCVKAVLLVYTMTHMIGPVNWDAVAPYQSFCEWLRWLPVPQVVWPQVSLMALQLLLMIGTATEYATSPQFSGLVCAGLIVVGLMGLAVLAPVQCGRMRHPSSYSIAQLWFLSARMVGMVGMGLTPLVLGVIGLVSGIGPSCSPQAQTEGSGLHWPQGIEWEQVRRFVSFAVGIRIGEAVIYLVVGLTVVLSVQQSISGSMKHHAGQLAQQIRAAIRHVSYQARGPLGGASLSLALLDQAVTADAIMSDAGPLLADLHASLQAAKRQLDDVLLFETMSKPQTEVITCEWATLAGRELRRLRNEFAGACRAQRIKLEFYSSGLDGESMPRKMSLEDMDQERTTWRKDLGWECYTNVYRFLAVIQAALSNSVQHVGTGGEGRIEVDVSVEPWPETGFFAAPKIAPERNARAGAHRVMEKRVLVVEVLDNGCGIPEERLDPGRLFRPMNSVFQVRADGRLTMDGVGLCMSKSIVVDQLGGEILIASKEGQGTLFSAAIPVWARKFEAELGPLATTTTRLKAMSHSSEAERSPRRPQLPTALVVDDEFVSRRALGRMLRHLGLNVIEFASGAELVSFLEHRFASPAGKVEQLEEELVLLTLDTQMTGLTGPQTFKCVQQLATRLQSEHDEPAAADTIKDMLTIAITGHADSTTHRMWERLGVADVLTKPVSPPDLMQLLTRRIPEAMASTRTHETTTAAPRG
jgi:CheY-like chemotaxis protein/signal transduction histidine kinase